jgi:hypothetical protein
MSSSRTTRASRSAAWRLAVSQQRQSRRHNAPDLNIRMVGKPQHRGYIRCVGNVDRIIKAASSNRPTSSSSATPITISVPEPRHRQLTATTAPQAGTHYPPMGLEVPAVADTDGTTPGDAGDSCSEPPAMYHAPPCRMTGSDNWSGLPAATTTRSATPEPGPNTCLMSIDSTTQGVVEDAITAAA